MSLIPNTPQRVLITGQNYTYTVEKVPYQQNYNIHLQRYFPDNNVILTLQKNISLNKVLRMEKIISVYWKKKFTHYLYDYLPKSICFVHDLIKETIYENQKQNDIQHRICLMIEISKHVSHLHKNDVAHQQLTPYTIGWTINNILVLFGFDLNDEINLTKPKRSQVEIDYAYRDPLYSPQQSYDFLNSQGAKKNDIWSLGAVFYYILTEQDLFENSKNNQENILNPFKIDEIKLNQTFGGSKVLDLNGQAKLKNLIKKMMSNDINLRPNIDDVLRQLTEIHCLGYYTKLANFAFPMPANPQPQVPVFLPLPSQTQQNPAAPPQQAPLSFPPIQQTGIPNQSQIYSSTSPQSLFQVQQATHHFQTAPQSQNQQQQQFIPNLTLVLAPGANPQSAIFAPQQASPAAQIFQNGQFQNQPQQFNGPAAQFNQNQQFQNQQQQPNTPSVQSPWNGQNQPQPPNRNG